MEHTTTLDDLAERAPFALELRRLQVEAMPWLAQPADGEGAPVAPGFERPVSKIEPLEWDDLIGQERVKHQLRVKIVSAKMRGEKMGHVLLADNRAGIGKTAVARLIAADLGLPILEISQPISAKDLVPLFNHARIDTDTHAVVFLDEIHELSKNQQDSMLTFMEPGGAISTKGGRRYYPNITVVGATTEIGQLNRPFLSRFTLRPIFERYDETELAMCTIVMADKYGIDLPNDTVEAIAGASAGSPRQIRHLVEGALDLITTKQPHAAEDILAFCGIFRDGLTVDHVTYLSALAAMNGRAGIDSLCTYMGRESKDLRRLEQLLFERHLVTIEGARVLTPAGISRLERAQRGED